MDVTVLYDVHHEAYWGVLIALYFYATGIAAGTCHYSSIYCVVNAKMFKPLAKYAALLSFLGFVIAPVILIYDLEQPLRFWHLFVRFNPTSAISWGTWLLTVYPILLLVYTYLLYKEDEGEVFRKWVKVVGIPILPLAVAVHAFTGFVFGLVQSRGYWYTSLMPLYFLMGAIISGFALVLIFSVIRHIWDRRKGREVISIELIQMSRYLLTWWIAVYPLFILSHMLMLLYGPEYARLAGMHALRDPLYLFGDIGLGVAVPLFLLFLPRTRTSLPWMTVAATLALVGVFFARYSIVSIGQAIPLT